jgi:hypothetical protein
MDWLPSPFSINLSHFPELTLGERLRLFSSLRCSHFPLSEVFVSEDPAENFFSRSSSPSEATSTSASCSTSSGGLDERWSLEATIAACRFVKRCLEQSASVTLPLPLSSPASPFFWFSGQRRSKLYPSSSLGLLVLALPRELSQRTCRVLYALGEDGIGIVTLKQLLHQEDLSQREHCPHSTCSC